MISIISTSKMTDPSVVSAYSLGLACSSESVLRGTGLSGISAARPLSSAALLPVMRERNERPIAAPAAAVAKGQAPAYAFAAVGAGAKQQTKQHQTTQHHTMWAFRGPEPWSDPA